MEKSVNVDMSLIATADERAEYGYEPDTVRNRRWLSKLEVGDTLTITMPNTVGWDASDASSRLRYHAKALPPASFKVLVIRSPRCRAVVATRLA